MKTWVNMGKTLSITSIKIRVDDFKRLNWVFFISNTHKKETATTLN